MSAIVFRIVTAPTIRTEYLTEDGKWVQDRLPAKIYSTYEEADAIATTFRNGDSWAAAAITERPSVHTMIRHDRDNAPANFAPQPPRPRLSRKERQRRRREEMRQDDLAELERIEIYE